MIIVKIWIQQHYKDIIKGFYLLWKNWVCLNQLLGKPVAVGNKIKFSVSIFRPFSRQNNVQSLHIFGKHHIGNWISRIWVLNIDISQIDPRISTSYRFRSELIITTYHLVFPTGMSPFLILFHLLLNDTSQNPGKKTWHS